TEYLVMEYLEGESLSDRLSKGALPLEQTLRYGSQMAEALEKAHRQGVVHRDLKPGNVMLTASGVKLLDFGLAKAMAAPGKQSGVTSFPTVAGGPSLTQEGTILGTFQYMAPEQLEGKEADARTDIFALGAVLYEMATGKKAFSGSSQASLISSIMKEDPSPISAIAPMSPPALDRVIRTCLAKDPEDRWQSARDVGNGLRWAAEEGSKAGVPAPVASRRRRREAIAWTVAGVAALAALSLAGFGALRRDAPPNTPRRLVLMPPGRAEVQFLAVSPDGSMVAMAVEEPSGRSALWLKDSRSLEPRELAGGEGAYDPFWSPDGKHIGFFTRGELRRIALDGGPPQMVAASDNLGGAWSRDGTILFTRAFGHPLFRVPAAGGTPEQVTRLDTATREVAHCFPQFLPDGRHYLFFVRNVDPTKSGIWLGSLDSRERSQLLHADAGPVYTDPGFLIFSRRGALFAQAFDPRSRRMSGEPVPLADKVEFEPSSNRLVASVGGGLAVYRTRGAASRALVWHDRNGRQLGPAAPPDDYRGISLSPDGKWLAAAIGSPELGTTDIWVRDLSRGTNTRVTFDPTDEFNAVWAPDGKIFYSSDREGLYHLYRRPASGSGEEEEVLKDGHDKWVTSAASDGSAILFSSFDAPTGFDIQVHALGGDGKTEVFRKTPFVEGTARFSPDSRWIAYAAGGSGRSEVFVAARSQSARPVQVSTEGGIDPQWSPDGRELYFFSRDGKLMASAIRETSGSI
ncbi:MAG TPA: protein kinase, partial [Thermoanaerobaculia bacterium]